MSSDPVFQVNRILVLGSEVSFVFLMSFVSVLSFSHFLCLPCVFIFVFVFVGPRVGGLDLFQNTCTALPSLHLPYPPTHPVSLSSLRPPPLSSCLVLSCLDNDV